MIKIEFTTMDKYFEETNDGCVVILDYITMWTNSIYKIGELLGDKLIVGLFSHPESGAHWLVLRDKSGDHFVFDLEPENVIPDKCGILSEPYTTFVYGYYKINTAAAKGKLIIRELNVPAHPDFLTNIESAEAYGYKTDPISIEFTKDEIKDFENFLTNFEVYGGKGIYKKDRYTFDISKYSKHTINVLKKALIHVQYGDPNLLAV